MVLVPQYLQAESWKAPARMATTANIVLTGLQTIDTVVGVAGDRVLVKNQAIGAENGIYVMSAGAWSRASDFSASEDVLTGANVYVVEGTAGGARSWFLTTTGAITLGVTALTFSTELTETSGPTALSFGAVPNGQMVVRSGASLVGQAVPVPDPALYDVFVDGLSDLPAPVGGVITLAANTSYGVKGLVDLGANSIRAQDGTVLIGLNPYNSGFTSSAAQPTLQVGYYNNGVPGNPSVPFSGKFTCQDLKITNTNASGWCFDASATNGNYTSTISFLRCTFFSPAGVAQARIGKAGSSGPISFQSCDFQNLNASAGSTLTCMIEVQGSAQDTPGVIQFTGCNFTGSSDSSKKTTSCILGGTLYVSNLAFHGCMFRQATNILETNSNRSLNSNSFHGCTMYGITNLLSCGLTDSCYLVQVRSCVTDTTMTFYTGSAPVWLEVDGVIQNNSYPYYQRNAEGAYNYIAAAPSGANNDYFPIGSQAWSGASGAYLNPSNAVTITGFYALYIGKSTKTIFNTSTTYAITLTNQDVASTAAYRIITPDGLPFRIPPGGSVAIKYDYTASRWRVVSNVVEMVDVLVTKLQDFPAPAGGVITLSANTSYGIVGTVDISTNYIVPTNGSSLVGLDPNATITSSGTRTVANTATSNVSWSARNLTIENTNANTVAIVETISLGARVVIDGCKITCKASTSTAAALVIGRVSSNSFLHVLNTQIWTDFDSTGTTSYLVNVAPGNDLTGALNFVGCEFLYADYGIGISGTSGTQYGFNVESCQFSFVTDAIRLNSTLTYSSLVLNGCRFISTTNVFNASSAGTISSFIATGCWAQGGSFITVGAGTITNRTLYGNTIAGNPQPDVYPRTVVQQAIYDNGNSGATKTINWNNGLEQKITMTADCVFTFTDPLPTGAACNLILEVIQDGTGGWEVTWDGDVRWPGGTPPTLTATASRTDVVSFFYDGSKYLGNYSLDFNLA